MPSRVVTKRRVKRRQQRLVSKNVKRKARTVRTLRKHRKSVKKVMRGGGKPINVNVKLLPTSGNTKEQIIVDKAFSISCETPFFSFNKKLIITITIDLNRYTDNILRLLNSLLSIILSTRVELDPPDGTSVLENVDEKSNHNQKIIRDITDYNEKYNGGRDPSEFYLSEEIQPLPQTPECKVVIELSLDNGETTINKLSIPVFQLGGVDIMKYKVLDSPYGGYTEENERVRRVNYWQYIPDVNLSGNVKRVEPSPSPYPNLKEIKEKTERITTLELTYTLREEAKQKEPKEPTAIQKLIACGLFESGTTVEEAESKFKVIEQAAKDINKAYSHFLDIVRKSNWERSSFNNEDEWKKNLEQSKTTFLETLTKKDLTKDKLNDALQILSDTKKNITGADGKAKSECKNLLLDHQAIINMVKKYGDIEASAVGSSIFDSIDVYKKFLPYTEYVPPRWDPNM